MEPGPNDLNDSNLLGDAVNNSMSLMMDDEGGPKRPMISLDKIPSQAMTPLAEREAKKQAQYEVAKNRLNDAYV